LWHARSIVSIFEPVVRLSGGSAWAVRFSVGLHLLQETACFSRCICQIVSQSLARGRRESGEPALARAGHQLNPRTQGPHRGHYDILKPVGAHPGSEFIVRCSQLDMSGREVCICASCLLERFVASGIAFKILYFVQLAPVAHLCRFGRARQALEAREGCVGCARQAPKARA
jgi:hypothetical protein